MRSVGIIGVIGSGKSEVARMLAEHGAVVIDADRVNHEAYAPGTDGHKAIVEAFGAGLVAEDGTIDRRKLGGIVFSNPERLQQLTSIVWPLARRLLEQRKQELTTQGAAVLVIEAAIMVEAGWTDLVDEVWLVRTPTAIARQRLMERRGLSGEDADARIASRQIEPLVAAASLIIENDGDIEELERKVDAAWQRISN